MTNTSPIDLKIIGLVKPFFKEMLYLLESIFLGIFKFHHFDFN